MSQPLSIVLTQAEFARLSEYSCSLPTGTTIGKRWKRDVNAFCKLDPERIDPFTGAQLRWPAEWWMGEYVPDADPKMVGIVWRPIVVVGSGQ